ncbi:MAG: hypothetical protein JHC26_11795 [Thermofilum sp.]|jgi:D-ribose pyranose/furanose isomerase RbsD|uniref:hypothetical protein n=1 Tax=Thermofilum sp. TaxID=1961369 RepID=UPI002585D92A|nr:hypothetical protein [Thermofilum sp.]MCI4409766.1 hypothetical protein [Thermofilum sp.]
MDPKRMEKIGKALERTKEAFGEELWNILTPEMKIFYVKTTLELMEENPEEKPSLLMLLELTRSELEQVMELEKRAKLMVLEAKTLEATATV